MEPQPPRPGQDPPTDQQPTGTWQQPPTQPAQPAWQAPAQPPAQPPGQWQQPAAPPAWQQPPAPAAWQQPPAQPSWGQPAQAGWGSPVEAVGQASTAVTISGILLLLISLVPAFFGAIILFLGGNATVIDDVLAQSGATGISGATIRDALVIIGIIVTTFGVLGILGGLGMILRRGWGRVFGFLVGLCGTLLGLLGLLGSLGSRGTSGAGTGIAITAVIFAIYAFALVETLIGGRHFRRG